jgi:predicted N-acetyltransferase YhbS
VTLAVLAESDLTTDDRAALRAFLVAAYAPDHADVFSRHDFWGGPPTARVVARDKGGDLLAHLGFSVRTIGVGGAEVRVAGVGAVATHPHWRGRGLGRLIFDRLAADLSAAGAAEFVFLECRDAVVPFYAACGFGHSVRTVAALDPATGGTDVSTSNVMVRPLGRAAFPPGDVDLRGQRW